MTAFFGKFRGKVQSNKDPMQMGRIQVSVPPVLGSGQYSWAMPSVPYAGPRVGFFFIPPDGANVWVEFEGGDKDHPVWSGCFWDKGDVPANPADAEMKVIKTDTSTITISDQKGSDSLTIETTSGMKIAFSSSDILIENGKGGRITITSSDIQIDDGKGGKVVVSGPKVTINDGALEVA
jgi:uncharacterized protein involved in type VI secretion and phage assembly